MIETDGRLSGCRRLRTGLRLSAICAGSADHSRNCPATKSAAWRTAPLGPRVRQDLENRRPNSTTDATDMTASPRGITLYNKIRLDEIGSTSLAMRLSGRTIATVPPSAIGHSPGCELGSVPFHLVGNTAFLADSHALIPASTPVYCLVINLHRTRWYPGAIPACCGSVQNLPQADVLAPQTADGRLPVDEILAAAKTNAACQLPEAVF